MRAISIDWQKTLQPYPGETIGQKINAAKAGKTFRELSGELNVSLEGVKTFFYRYGSSGHYPGTKLRQIHVCSQPRPDYAAMIAEVIEGLAREQGITPEACREWIQTEAGEAEFRWRCFLTRVPLFECRRREKLWTRRQRMGK